MFTMLHYVRGMVQWMSQTVNKEYTVLNVIYSLHNDRTSSRHNWSSFVALTSKQVLIETKPEQCIQYNTRLCVSVLINSIDSNCKQRITSSSSMDCVSTQDRPWNFTLPFANKFVDFWCRDNVAFGTPYDFAAAFRPISLRFIAEKARSMSSAVHSDQRCFQVSAK